MMGNWATGVTVVTSRGPHGPHGMTANAFLSVSLAPPLVLVSIGRDNDSHAIITASGRFAVSLLAEGQEALSVHFAQRFKDPAQAMAGIAWSPGPDGLPFIDGAIGHLACAVSDAFAAQDHTLFLARVTHVAAGANLPPLVYFRSTYTGLR